VAVDQTFRDVLRDLSVSSNAVFGKYMQNIYAIVSTD